jgi:hypothetical protein
VRGRLDCGPRCTINGTVSVPVRVLTRYSAQMRRMCLMISSSPPLLCGSCWAQPRAGARVGKDLRSTLACAPVVCTCGMICKCSAVMCDLATKRPHVGAHTSYYRSWLHGDLPKTACCRPALSGCAQHESARIEAAEHVAERRSLPLKLAGYRPDIVVTGSGAHSMFAHYPADEYRGALNAVTSAWRAWSKALVRPTAHVNCKGKGAQRRTHS